MNRENARALQLIAIERKIRQMDQDDVRRLGKLLDLMEAASDSAIDQLVITAEAKDSLRERLDAGIAYLKSRQPPADTEPEHA